MEELVSAVTTADTVLFVGGSSISTSMQAAKSNRGWCRHAPAAGGYVTRQDQSLNQEANTGQGAFSKAVARQHGLNDSSPVKEGECKNRGKSGHSCGAPRNRTGCTGTHRALRVGLRMQGNTSYLVM